MTYLESEETRVMDKLHKEIFNCWKFKMKMILASMDL